MKKNIVLGAFLIALGIAAFAYQGINFKTRETAADFGGVKITAEKTKHIPISPIVGLIFLIGGIGLMVSGPKQF